MRAVLNRIGECLAAFVIVAGGCALVALASLI